MYCDLPSQQFATVVIDPPWPISMAGKRKVSRHARPDTLPYRTNTIEEIKSFPMAQVAATGAHVYVWTTNAMLPVTFDVMNSWGVRYHLTMPLVKRSGIAPCNGYVFGSEFCLLGFHGRPMLPFTGMGKLNWLATSPVAGRHSAKPDEFYELVESMSPGPRVDLFARRGRDGWPVWGDAVK